MAPEHHHHHYHHHHHHHHHNHHHGDEPEKSIGEKNKQHYNQLTSDIFSIPWIADMSYHIVKELQENVAWIEFKHSESESASGPIKMLDYACGNGLASRALAPFVDEIRGVDISSGMAEQYNNKAQEEGFSPQDKRAIQGDLLNPRATPSPELSTPEFHGFDIITMCMALHHVEDYTVMIQKLSERLCEGGVLVIIDWVSPSESGCGLAENVVTQNAQKMSGHTITRLGFKENDVKAAYEKAGLEDWAWRWTSQKSRMPEEIGGEQQLFFARGQKPAAQQLIY